MPFDREEALRKADRLLRQNRIDLAIAEYRAVVDDQPNDLNTANTLGDLFYRNGQVEQALTEYRRIADVVAGQGFLPRAAALYKKVLKIKPDDEHAAWQLAVLSADQGLLADARAHFQAIMERRRRRGDQRGEAEARICLGELDPSDVDARVSAAKMRAELGQKGEAVAKLKGIAAELDAAGATSEAARVLDLAAHIDPDDRELRRALSRAEGEAVVEDAAPLTFDQIEASLGSAIARERWEDAAQMLDRFTRETPGHIPALMRLVEVCVDGGLESLMFDAQVRLTDAYLAVGAALEARLLAEDLVSRDPACAEHAERLARARALGGEPEADGQDLAEPAAGETFRSADLLWQDDEATDSETISVADLELVDLSGILTADVAAVFEVHAAGGKRDPLDVDLSGVLAGLPEEAHPKAADDAPPIEQVFGRLREEAAREVSAEIAEQQFALAASYIEIGCREDAVQSLMLAARSPRHRFRAAAMIASISRDDGNAARAIEWYERAADAPPPAPAARHAVLYDLAAALESCGEGARALAVLLELKADAGDYRDVARRLELLKVQMGG